MTACSNEGYTINANMLLEGHMSSKTYLLTVECPQYIYNSPPSNAELQSVNMKRINRLDALAADSGRIRPLFRAEADRCSAVMPTGIPL